MSKLPQNGVHADSPSVTVFRLHMPQGIRLHEGRLERFTAFQRGRIFIKTDAHPVLRDFLDGLREEVEDLAEVSGDYFTVNVRVHCASAVEYVLKHAALACVKNGLPFSYDSGREISAPKVYAA